MAVTITADVSDALRGIDDALRVLKRIASDPKLVQLAFQYAERELENIARLHLVRAIDKRTTRRTGRLRSSARFEFRTRGRTITALPHMVRYGYVVNARGSGSGFIQMAFRSAGSDPRIRSILSDAVVRAFNVLLRQSGVFS